MPATRNENRRSPSGNVRQPSADPDAAAVLQIRRFNRTVAERIGGVHDRFLHHRRPMNEARLIWEIGREGEELRTLRMRLGLDSGYLKIGRASCRERGEFAVARE